jgi:hypothetical protein
LTVQGLEGLLPVTDLGFLLLPGLSELFEFLSTFEMDLFRLSIAAWISGIGDVVCASMVLLPEDMAFATASMAMLRFCYIKKRFVAGLGKCRGFGCQK